MNRAGAFGGGGGIGLPYVPKLTRIFIGALVALSISAGLLGPWLGIVNLWELLAFSGAEVLGGQVWRLVTFPWITGSPFGLLFGVLGLVFFAAPMESAWGRKAFLRRTLVLVLVPALLLTLLGLLSSRLASVRALGPEALILAFLTAFASELRGQRIMLFPIPIQLTGDTILWLSGGLLGLYVLFSGTVLPYLPLIFTFGLALLWFRFGFGRNLRRSWLRMKKRMVEARIQRARKKRNLRVVRGEDDEEPRRYLH